MKKSSLIAAAMIAAMGAGVSMAPTQVPKAIHQTGVTQQRKKVIPFKEPSDIWTQLQSYRKRPGWTNARYKRHAIKLRNRVRNRSAHK